MALVNILHLSDIHFGAEQTPKTSTSAAITSTHLAQRINTLNGLIKCLEQFCRTEPKWKPHVVVISGDIAWKALPDDYKQAKDFLSQLSTTFNLTSKEFILCPGNHDINRSATIGLGRPTDTKQSDDWLKLETLDNLKRPFENYIKFCEDFGVAPLSISDQSNHLVGFRDLLDLRFVVLNSSWFSRGDDDKNKLYIGFPQLQLMSASSKLFDPDNCDNEHITISILHHPPDWLHEDETNGYTSRQITYKYLADRSHVILSGHTHNNRIIPPDKRFDSAYLFVGGASYEKDDYYNNFSIYQINLSSRSLTRRGFEFDPRDGSWAEDLRSTSSLSLKKK